MQKAFFVAAAGILAVALTTGLAPDRAQAAPVCDDDRTTADGAHKHLLFPPNDWVPNPPSVVAAGKHDHGYKNCQNAVDQLDADNAAQDIAIAGNAAGVAANAAKDLEQDGRLDGHDATLADHDGRILDNEAGVAANKVWNQEQDVTLGEHNARILANLNKNVEQDGRLDGHDQQFRVIDQRFENVDRRIDRLNDRVDEVGAIALALDNPGVDGATAGAFSVYGGSATMNGKIGFGLGLNYNVLDNFRVYAGGGTDVNANNYAGKVGAVWTFR